MKNRLKKYSLKVLSIERLKIEKTLIISFLVCLSVLIIAQLLMVNSEIRTFLTQEERVEGVFMDNSGVLYDKGFLVMELINKESMNDVWIMVNGERVANFYKKQVSISVKDSDLVEIDARTTNSPAKVRVSSFSSNVKLLIDNSGKEFDKNIGIIARVRIK